MLKSTTAIAIGLSCLSGYALAATPYGLGRNDYSPLGNGTLSYRTIAAPVLTQPDAEPITGVSFIAAGSRQSIFLKSDGTAWHAGGADYIGQGIGTSPRKLLASPVLEAPGGAPFTGAIAASCGSGFTLFLKSDGTAWSTTTALPHPEPVLSSVGGPPLADVTAVAAGSLHRVFLRSDGTVWTSGGNTYGQLGDGTTTSRTIPAPVLVAPGGLPFGGVTAIAASEQTTLLLKSDGTVWTMGANFSGQLGDGTTLTRTTPVQVRASPAGPPFTGVAGIQAGSSFSLLLKSDGSVWAMGSNSSGNLGNGTAQNSSIPVQVLDAPSGSPFAGAAAIRTVYNHSLLLRNDGSAWAWGNNSNTQLADGSGINRSTPVPVAAPGGGPLGGITAIAAGWYHSLFLKSDGTVLAAGWNVHGQLGDGLLHHATSPVAMRSPENGPHMENIIEVAVGKVHALILKADGTLWSTGSNGHGQLGNGSIRNNQQHIIPGPVLTAEGGPQVTDVIAIAAGTYHSVFVKSDGSLWAFGENEGRQLGDGTTTDRPYPVAIRTSANGPLVSGVKDVAAGHLHTAFVKTDGSAWALGSNANGQLGDSTYSASSYPIRVRDSTRPGLSDVAKVSAGTFHTLFLKNDGSAWGVGRNAEGQLGTQSGSPTWSALRVRTASGTNLAGVTAISAGSFHSAFLLNDSTLWTCGRNTTGELGRGSAATLFAASPVLTGPGGAAVTGVVSVAASIKPEPDAFPNEAHTSFIKTDGTLWVTGGNSYGQLGNGGTTKSDYPIQVPASPGGLAFTGASKVAAGTYNTMVLVSEQGTYATWLDGFQALSGAAKLTSSDPDQDAIPNLLEYILGSQPTQAGSSLLPVATFSSGTQTASLSFTRIASSAQDTILACEHGTNLADWTSIDIDALPTPSGVTLGTVDANGRQTVTITLPASGSSAYFRLKARLK